ncbi:MAG TPA: DUF3574 domain-containing protein [Stellaceae bacterium]|nr:DUF3574 domain-containing protein [Stellaceae bacterium]
MASAVRDGKTFAGAVLLAAALAGCARGEAEHECARGTGSPMVVYDLFFGRTIDGRSLPVSDAEWAAFVERVVTPNLPAGFTVVDGEGQWQDPASGQIIRDPTKVLIAAAPASAQTAAAIDTIKETYKRQFKQRSVGMISHAGCADFED